MFETDADMLCKRKPVCFGHKLCRAFGKTGVVLAADIPHDVAIDLGFASRQNVGDLDALGVRRIAIPRGHVIDGQGACGRGRVQRKP